jgi:DNA-directed RNA polymerase subunit D
MEVEIIEQNKKEGKIKFILSKTTPAYANTIRRIMMSEVPTMAMEDIEFRQNNSVLYDEMIALRLGLIPLTTDIKAYNLPSKCTCSGAGCARCQLKMTLKATGPKTVYASDIKSKDPKVKPVYDKMIILKLLEGQVLEFEATAVLGQGKEHTKWSPGHIYFQNVPQIKILKQPKDAQKFADACPRKIFENKAGKLGVIEKKIYNCDLCESCLHVADENGAVEVKSDETEFLFTIESWGQLSPKEMIEKTVEVFDEKLEELKGLLKE